MYKNKNEYLNISIEFLIFLLCKYRYWRIDQVFLYKWVKNY